jgi:hypothetical protein
MSTLTHRLNKVAVLVTVGINYDYARFCSIKNDFIKNKIFKARFLLITSIIYFICSAPQPSTQPSRSTQSRMPQPSVRQ